MQSLDDFAQAKLAGLAERSLKRTIAPTHRLDGLWVMRGGKKLLSFSCNDYLNLSHHPSVKAAAKAAVDEYGAGAGASRLITGDHPLMSALEARLAAFKGTEAACVFGSGYLTNTGVIPTLVGEGDLLLVDELAHSCIHAGSRLSHARVEVFRHNDLQNMQEKLRLNRAAGARCLIATDGVFSMDGDLAPLAELSEIAAANDCWLLSDDAHGLGVIGDGRGAVAAAGAPDVPLQMGTLSKSLGSYGGYICASAPVIDMIKTRARTLVYATGLPPASAAAALAALDIIESDPELCAQPLRKARAFAEKVGLAAPQSSIVPLVLGEAESALAASKTLEDQGFLVSAIRPPTVPAGTARLRFAFTAGHPEYEVDRLAEQVQRL